MNEELFKDVNDLLKIHGLTYKWMMSRLGEKGCKVDKVSISKWAHGVQITDKAYKVHDLCIVILEEYRKSFAEKVKDL